MKRERPFYTARAVAEVIKNNCGNTQTEHPGPNRESEETRGGGKVEGF